MTPNPTTVTVAEAPRRIGKSLYWCAQAATDGVWRDVDGTGEWRKPSAIGFPKDDATISKQYDFYRLEGEDSIAFRELLRKDLASVERRALIMGDLAEDVSLAEERNSWKTILSLPRRKGLFVDSPKAFLTLDCDKLDLRLHHPEIDVVAQDDEMPDIFADTLDRMGLDWLIADAVIHLSSTHGYLDRHTFKAHIEWHLDEALTLAQQKSVATYVNTQARAAGFGDIVDLSIYTPERLIFTAPAALHKRTWYQGRGIVTEPAHGPTLQRVRLVRRGQPRIEIPDEALTSARIATFTRTIAKTKTAAPGETALKPGNVYQAVRARVYAKALRTPASKAPRALAELTAQLQQAIEALPDSDADTLARRLRHIAPLEMRRSWDAAVAKRRPWQHVPDYAPTTAHSISAARAITAKAMEDFIAEALDRLAGRQRALEDESMLQPEPPKPLHLLLRAPPGVGKTFAALAAVKLQHMMTHRITYLSPTVRLSEEALARKAATLPDDEYIRTRARHHKGRAHLCKNVEYDKLAKRLEEIGRSPVKDVCGRCPTRDACAWPAQQSDVESGLVAGQHAHATTAMQRVSEDSAAMPAYGIIDESLIGTLLEETQQQRGLAALKRAALKTVIRRDDGSPSLHQTNDLRAYRSFALTALTNARTKLRVSDVLYYGGSIVVTTKDGGRIQRTRLEDARASEAAARRTYDHQLKEALAAIHMAKATLSASTKAERAMTQALSQIKLSKWFDDLYRAINASLRTKRDHVFGVLVHNGKVTLHIRASLPTPLTARSWVWLDGTANQNVWAASLSHAQADLRVMDIRTEPGAYHLTQYPDRPYGKGMFTQAQGDSSRANIQKLRRYVHWLAAKHRGKDPQADVLVICQKPVESLLQSLGLPANVRTEHFNNLRGLDRYRSTPCAVIVGRPLPTTTAVETATEALYYDDANVLSIPHADRWRPGKRTLALANGTAISVPTEQHPDPKVEALRHQMADSEVRQAVLRLRVYDRPASNPAELHVFGQADTGLPIHELADWVDAERENAQVIEASGVLSVRPAILQCQNGGFLTGVGLRTLERVVAEIVADDTQNRHDAIEDSFLGEAPTILSLGVMAVLGGGCNNVNKFDWECWSVRFEIDRGLASRVWVDGARFPDAKVAIERETGLQVLSLSRALLREGGKRRRGVGGASMVASTPRGRSVAPPPNRENDAS